MRSSSVKERAFPAPPPCSDPCPVPHVIRVSAGHGLVCQCHESVPQRFHLSIENGPPQYRTCPRY
eukprot:585765-Rhodomonas_salina.1